MEQIYTGNSIQFNPHSTHRLIALFLIYFTLGSNNESEDDTDGDPTYHSDTDANYDL